MKKVIPDTGKVAKDAKECCQECASEFISFITSEASERCQNEKRKTINGEDIIYALQTLGFDPYVEPLQIFLRKYRESFKGGSENAPIGPNLRPMLTDVIPEHQGTHVLPGPIALVPTQGGQPRIISAHQQFIQTPDPTTGRPVYNIMVSSSQGGAAGSGIFTATPQPPTTGAVSQQTQQQPAFIVSPSLSTPGSHQVLTATPVSTPQQGSRTAVRPQQVFTLSAEGLHGFQESQTNTTNVQSLDDTPSYNTKS